METLKWVCIIFFIMQNSALSSSNRVPTEKDYGTYGPEALGLGLGWSWGGIPSLGIGPGSGNIAFGSSGGDSGTGGGQESNNDRGHDALGFSFGGGNGYEGHGKPAFGFHFGGGNKGDHGEGGSRGFAAGGGGGGGGHYWGSRGPGGCRCDCRRGSKGHRRKDRKPSTRTFTCRPMDCTNDSDCGGYSKRADGSVPYWCRVPGKGTLPFWCTGSKNLNCEPINCPRVGACGGGGAIFVLDIPVWEYDHGRQKNAGEPREAGRSDAAEVVHN